MSHVRVKVKMPPGVIPLATLRPEVLGQALDSLGTFAVKMLSDKAQSELSPFAAQNYIRGLQQAESVVRKGNLLTITLVGDTANAYEQGTGPWDIKAKMLAKAKKKDKDGNPLVDVPFEHGTPGSTGKAPMTMKAYRIMNDLAAMSKAAAKKPLRGPHTMPGDRITKKVKLPGTEQMGSYTHKRGLYDDMLKSVKKTGRGSTTRYTTIRRISKNSDPASWIHPGIKAHHFMKDVKEEIEKLAPRVITDYLKNM